MIKKTVTYKDIDGNEYSDTLLFDFLPDDITGMLESGYFEEIRDKFDSDSVKVKCEAVKEVIDRAYGFRYIDEESGKSRFRHATDDELKAFHDSDAYKWFKLDLYTNPDAADDFASALFSFLLKRN